MDETRLKGLRKLYASENSLLHQNPDGTFVILENSQGILGGFLPVPVEREPKAGIVGYLGGSDLVFQC